MGKLIAEPHEIAGSDLKRAKGVRVETCNSYAVYSAVLIADAM